MKTRINGIDVYFKKCKYILSPFVIEIIIYVVLAVSIALLIGGLIK